MKKNKEIIRIVETSSAITFLLFIFAAAFPSNVWHLVRKMRVLDGLEDDVDRKKTNVKKGQRPVCEYCGEKENLHLHHGLWTAVCGHFPESVIASQVALINKDHLDFPDYLKHHWAFAVFLCADCHHEEHHDRYGHTIFLNETQEIAMIIDGLLEIVKFYLFFKEEDYPDWLLRDALAIEKRWARNAGWGKNEDPREMILGDALDRLLVIRTACLSQSHKGIRNIGKYIETEIIALLAQVSALDQKNKTKKIVSTRAYGPTDVFTQDAHLAKSRALEDVGVQLTPTQSLLFKLLKAAVQKISCREIETSLEKAEYETISPDEEADVYQEPEQPELAI